MFIGVDLGTSGVKVILTNNKGEVINTAKRSYDLIIPKASWIEQDPNAWLKQTLEALKEVVVGYENDIQGMSFSGQMHGLVLLDENDKVLRNALLWNDQRTINQVEYLNQTVGKDSLLKYTGNIALTGLTAPKILWVKEHEPDIFDKISKIMLPKDFLVYKLSGAFASDVSDLSGTLYFNPEKRDYSPEMLDILDITRDMLPSVHESFDVVGTMNDDIKNILNITQDVHIIVGGGDQAVGAVGVGVVGDGECSLSLGTSGVIFVSSNTFKIDHKSYLQSYAHANGNYHMMAVMLNAAGAIKWWNNAIFNTDDFEAYYKQVVHSKPDNDIYFLPYLTGERAPINDPYAKGVFYGLGVHHTKEDMDRAVVEGVTFALRDSFTLIQDLGVDIKRVRLTGGGAKSDVWAQMISDVFNVEVAKITSEEGPALGAAILAMVGCKEYPTVQSACKQLVTLGKEFTPNTSNVNAYNKKYNKFVQLYPTLKALFKSF
ncbi:MAG: xylulokinase [Candidatus Izemoplasma sp.]|nr:xylulokinase [Candidatus Izemoplasma sp.]